MSGTTIVILVAAAVAFLAALLPVVRRIFGWIVLLANSVASGWIFILMFLVTLDIIMRFVFGGPISGVTEIVEISIVAVLYLQITHALKVGRITRSDALYSTILRRFPVVGHLLGVIFHAAGAWVMVVIVVGGWPKWLQAYNAGHFVGNVGVFTFPEWPQRIMLVVGCAMMAIQFALLAVDHVRGMFGLPPLETEAPVDVETEALDDAAGGGTTP